MRRGWIAAVGVLLASPALADDWTSWRGPHQDGVADEKGIVDTFGLDEHLLWSAEVSGRGTPVVFGDALASRLIAKPLVRNVLHGGGIVFDSESDPHVKVMRYWIEHPMPEGQDEFSSAGNGLFTPPDAATGACNVE